MCVIEPIDHGWQCHYRTHPSFGRSQGHLATCALSQLTTHSSQLRKRPQNNLRATLPPAPTTHNSKLREKPQNDLRTTCALNSPTTQRTNWLSLGNGRKYLLFCFPYTFEYIGFWIDRHPCWTCQVQQTAGHIHHYNVAPKKFNVKLKITVFGQCWSIFCLLSCFVWLLVLQYLLLE